MCCDLATTEIQVLFSDFVCTEGWWTFGEFSGYRMIKIMRQKSLCIRFAESAIIADSGSEVVVLLLVNEALICLDYGKYQTYLQWKPSIRPTIF